MQSTSTDYALHGSVWRSAKRLPFCQSQVSEHLSLQAQKLAKNVQKQVPQKAKKEVKKEERKAPKLPNFGKQVKKVARQAPSPPKAPVKKAQRQANKATKATKGWFGGAGGAQNLDQWYGERFCVLSLTAGTWPMMSCFEVGA